LNPTREKSVFFKRTVITLLGVPLVIAVVWFGLPWFTVFAAAWGLGAAWEYFNIVTRSKGLNPLTAFGLLWVGLLIISPDLITLGNTDLQMIFSSDILLTGAIVISLMLLLVRKDKANAFANWAWTIGGILYIGWLLSYMVSLRTYPDGRGWVFLAIACTFASDISAYLGGRTFGRHKLAPYVSPNKTWEGACFGILGAAIIGVLARLIFNIPVSYAGAVILGVMVSVFGQIGDLVKSLFKRNMTVKDSSQAIPGHGGFLDRMDSMAFAGVAVYLYVYFSSPFLY
jgi:phosphatidate cytidylyltransferase